MKTKLFLVLIGLVLLASCKRQVIRNIEKDMSDGYWKINLFFEDGMNITGDYSFYTFTFKDDGTVRAANNGFSVFGTWKVKKDDGKVKFYLDLGSPIDELSEDWEVISNTNTKLELQDERSDGKIDLLTFVKL